MNIKSNHLKTGTFNNESKQDDILKGGIKSSLKVSFNSDKSADKELNELFTLIQLIDNMLSSNATLTKQQILDYCKSQRYFIKLYMKKVMEKDSH
ncbi:MAG: hypothetical protein ACFFBP_13545 [Promethearchaeota archaeon]